MFAEVRQKSEFIGQLLQPDDFEFVKIDRSSSDSKVAIELDQCSFSWGTDKFRIAPTTLTVNAGEMVMVVGRVGSGKSSFVTALCGEMPIAGGSGKVHGRIGYVEQKPTILDDTLRENVLMGQDFDEKFFWQVIEACDLTQDIQEMPESDLTEVGTSGALYLRADVYIFDDLLSAVDTRVEKHIVDKVLSSNGIIGTKTRILVTHALHVLPLGNKIITFVDGCADIVEQTPKEVVDANAISDDERQGTETTPSKTDTPESTNKKKPLHSDEIDFDNPPVKWSHMLQVLGLTDRFIGKLIRLNALNISTRLTPYLARLSQWLVETMHTELIRSTILVCSIWWRFYTEKAVSSGEIDAVISLSTGMARYLNILFGMESNFNRFRRRFSIVLFYLENLPQEAPTTIQHSRPPKDWPHAGTIEFENYSMRYHSGLDLVLKDLSFSVRSNEKIGIVGRTGAGKSSMAQALMRIVEPASGKIVIDGVDISSIGLFDLRSRISIIPQDPALFTGTIRDNLDPLHQHSDEAIWKAIKLAHIADLLEIPTGKYVKPDMTKDLPDDYNDVGPWIEGVRLQKWVEHDGKNFSVGQRQLISLCRALLWRRKILLLDEATANVDSKTDQIMQSVIRKEFKNCTILTIAHRLGTIMDSDRILVVDDGQIVEFDTPADLLKRNGHFALLVESMNQAQNK
ncbi:ABC transporter C member 13 [Coemansia sp. RSA 1843]|nr:ABC transporter C member 13 [Coemansia sp. RSA 1843]